MNMTALHTRTTVIRAAVLSLLMMACGWSQAQTMASGAVDVSGPQGTLVSPVFEVSFTPGLPLFAFDFELSFDNQVLTWQEAGSTLSLNNGASSNFPALPSDFAYNLVLNGGTSSLLLSYIPSLPLDLTGLTFAPQFLISSGAPIGNVTAYFTSTFYEDGLVANEYKADLSALVTVTAIPEPTTWLQLLSGLGVLALGATRSRRTACAARSSQQPA